MAQHITLTAADGHELDAWRTDPAGTGTGAGKVRGGIVVLHAVFGRTTHMGDVCDQFAGAGYAAIAPSLYDRVGKNIVHPYDETGVEAGRKSYGALTPDQILADTAAGRDALGWAGPVAVSGFCTGGTWAWVAAATLDFDGAVIFYGSQVPAHLRRTPRCPTVHHYGDADHVVPLADIEKIRAANPDIPIHIYPGGKHAFFNPDQASYDAEIAALAFRRAVDFLADNMAGRV